MMRWLRWAVLALLPFVASAQPPGGGSLVNPNLTFIVASPTNGQVLTYVSAAGAWENATGGGGGSAAFSSLTSGTNTAAAMLVGTGASLGFTGSGTLNANEIIGYTFPALVTGEYLTNNGSALSWSTIAAATTFDQLGTGTNTSAAMTLGTGSSLSFSGTGTINANELNGGAIPASAVLLGTNSSQQPVAVTAGGCVGVTGGVISISAPINPQTGTSYTVQTTDACGLVTFSNASAVAVTVPRATGSFGVNFSFDVENLGAGTATLTPTTSTINGAATLTVATNTGCTVTSDGTNWQVSACTAITPSSGGGSAGTFASFSSSTVSEATTDYFNGFGGVAAALTSAVGGPIATSATLDNLYIKASNAPASGQTFIFTLYTGAFGSESASSVTCTISNPATTCSDTTHSVSVTAGQHWAVQIVTSTTSGNTGIMFIGVGHT